jgi:hypothetical protein
MAIPSFDVVMYSFLTYGLDYIRAHSEVIDEIFAYLKDEPYQYQFGDKQIQQIKEWYTTNNIPVKLAFNLTPQDIPCYSIHLAESRELVEGAFFGDYAGEILEDKVPRVIIPEFVPENYDEVNAIISVPSIIDLTLVRPAHIVKDAKGQLFEIIDITGQKVTIIIDSDSPEPDMAKVTIQSFITQNTYKKGEAFLNEQIDIGVHSSTAANTVLWMYQILIWVLFRFKPELERRCVDLSTFTASDFRRDSQYLGDQIFSRWVRVSGRTKITWKEDLKAQIDTIVATIEEE